MTSVSLHHCHLSLCTAPRVHHLNFYFFITHWRPLTCRDGFTICFGSATKLFRLKYKITVWYYMTWRAQFFHTFHTKNRYLIKQLNQLFFFIRFLLVAPHILTTKRQLIVLSRFWVLEMETDVGQFTRGTLLLWSHALCSLSSSCCITLQVFPWQKHLWMATYGSKTNKDLKLGKKSKWLKMPVSQLSIFIKVFCIQLNDRGICFKNLFNMFSESRNFLHEKNVLPGLMKKLLKLMSKQ